MTKKEALDYMILHPGVVIQIDWWDDSAGIKFVNNKFVSLPGCEIDIKFLLEDANYIISDYFPDKELGGLFSYDPK